MKVKETIVECVRTYLDLPARLTPTEYAEKVIDFKYCVGANEERLNLELSPYLVDVIDAFDFSDAKKEITLIGVEQGGKSLSFTAGLLWAFKYKPCVSMIIYPSLDKAVTMNELKISPLLKAIPEYALELKRRDSTRVDCYNLSKFRSYFMGSGGEITSISAQVVICDEVDDIIEEQNSENKLNAMRKRLRSYDESLFCKVSTVRGQANSKIWREFVAGSQGYWHLRCVKCDTLSMRSADIYNMQFEKDEDGNHIPGTCRLICPVCGHKHVESDKSALNQRGAYVHKYPERQETNVSYHFGGLAVCFGSLTWDHIAEAQLRAGASGERTDQMYLDNSIRGVPWSPRKNTQKNVEVLKARCIPRDEYPNMRFVFMAVDTQNNGLFYIIRGVDNEFNTYLIEEGFVHDFNQLAELYKTEYCGLYCTMGIIDEGGHRLQEIKNFIAGNPGFYQYKGNPRIGVPWKISEESRRRILANPKHFQSELLYKIYNKPVNGQGDWHLHNDISQEYVDQLLDVRKTAKGSDSYDDWESATQNDHLFDCEKMFLVILEYFKAVTMKNRKQ